MSCRYKFASCPKIGMPKGGPADLRRKYFVLRTYRIPLIARVVAVVVSAEDYTAQHL